MLSEEAGTLAVETAEGTLVGSVSWFTIQHGPSLACQALNLGISLFPYPFGHGLSYTRFEYRDLEITKAGAGLTITCTVANVGDRMGHEVVQLYVGDPKSRVARPPRELKAFARIELAPGAVREVSFTLSARDLSYWSSRRGWTLEPGEFGIQVGASSRDIRLAQPVTVEA